MFAKKLAVAAALLAATNAHAASTIFFDNFDADAPLLDATSFAQGWSVTNGYVDVIGQTGGYDLIPFNGYYIDLDGSQGKAGVFSNSVAVVKDQTYTLSFSLAGNNRSGYGDDNVTVNFGTSSQNIFRSSSAGFQTFTLNFTADATGSATFSFANAGGDNVGALLDNVSVTAVPEPSTYAMLVGGLGLLGVAARRRRNG